MEKDDTDAGGISEADLVGLLVSLKVEPTPEADFETRFICDLRERLARESVCCPARRLLWDHILQMFANLGSRKLAYCASSLGLGALAVAFFALPGDPASQGAAAVQSQLSRLEHSLASLRSHAGREAAPCTTIRICEQKKPSYTEENLVAGALSNLFGRASSANAPVDFPVNMGLAPLESEDLPAFSAAAGF